MYRSKLFLVLLLGVLTSIGAYAKPTFPPIVRETYQIKSGGRIDNELNSCGLCHLGGPPTLNPYGKVLQGALNKANTGMLTSQILHSVDNVDPDGTGFTVAQDFAADVPPGDPSIHPPKGTKPAVSAAAPATTSTTAAAASPTLMQQIIKLAFPKHAQHPVITHFPIALFVFGFLLDILAWWKKNTQMAYAGYLCLIGAAITAPLSVITGLLAWHFVFGGFSGTPLTGVALYHLILACVTTVLMLILAFQRKKNQEITPGYLTVAFITVIILSITGHLGGTLSGVN